MPRWLGFHRLQAYLPVAVHSPVGATLRQWGRAHSADRGTSLYVFPGSEGLHCFGNWPGIGSQCCLSLPGQCPSKPERLQLHSQSAEQPWLPQSCLVIL